MSTAAAIALWASDDETQWQSAYDRYEDALNKIISIKGALLRDLDNFIQKEACTLIKSRHPKPYITSEELCKIMKWKITRGKFRPLMKLVESNSDSTVKEVSSRAFQFLQDKKYDAALHCISELRGVGVATGSAILCILEPHEFPFMSDEALLICCPNVKKEYNIKMYDMLRTALRNKATELGKAWTSEKVGKCLWTLTILGSSSGVETSEKQRSTKKRKANDC